MNRIPFFLSAVSVLAALPIAVPAARADVTIVAPGAQTSTEGDFSNFIPFNILTNQRYQQIYNATEFGALTGPEQITQIAFRVDSTGSAFSTTLTGVRIDLSTSSAAADTLSHTFADNVGANDITVFNGALSLSSVGPTSSPAPFDIVIPLATPFTYDPTAGNLLLDVRNFDGGTTTQFDAQADFGDGISRVFSSDSGVNQASGVGDTAGLVTQFTFGSAVTVPETASLPLIAWGIALIGIVRRRSPA